MVLTILVLVAAGGLALALRDREPGGGPLSAGTGGFSYTHRLGVGEIFSLGHVLFTNGAKKPAVIERVRLLGVTDGLELLGMRTRPVPDQEGKGMFLGANGFPPPEWPSQPFARANQVPVPREFNEEGDPIEGLELVIGVRATRPGVARFRAVEFTYKVGGRRYREEWEGSIYLCAPSETYTNDTCPGAAKDDFSDRLAEWPAR